MKRAPRKRALLVGINYPGTQHALRGCVNDVVQMNHIIATKYGFTNNKDRRMLTDNSATTKNILSRLEWLVDDAQPGDVLFFHYSGHGSQMIDTDYDSDSEPDNKDEILCPIDLNWRDRVIKDDDLKRIFNKVPEGVNLTVILDCCHSGGGIDSMYQYQPLGTAGADYDSFSQHSESPNRSKMLPMPVDIANRGYGMDLPVRERGLMTTENAESHGILISGCQSNQTSADAYIRNRFVGAATFYLAQTLHEHNYDITYKDLVDQMNTQMVHNGYTQRPELNGPISKFETKFLEPLV